MLIAAIAAVLVYLLIPGSVFCAWGFHVRTPDGYGLPKRCLRCGVEQKE